MHDQTINIDDLRCKVLYGGELYDVDVISFIKQRFILRGKRNKLFSVGFSSCTPVPMDYEIPEDDTEADSTFDANAVLQAGIDAAEAGKTLEDNPYDAETDPEAHELWAAGFEYDPDNQDNETDTDEQDEEK